MTASMGSNGFLEMPRHLTAAFVLIYMSTSSRSCASKNTPAVVETGGRKKETVVPAESLIVSWQFY
jgi:hypothetical protein